MNPYMNSSEQMSLLQPEIRLEIVNASPVTLSSADTRKNLGIKMENITYMDRIPGFYRINTDVFKYIMKNFIVTRTPHRISFLGGGSDIKSFYKDYGGASLSTAINNYVYVGVKRHSKLFDEKYRIVYSITELQNNLKSIKNDIVSETKL